jgi:hypothetical protein
LWTKNRLNVLFYRSSHWKQLAGHQQMKFGEDLSKFLSGEGVC